jgi:rod shape-determining protein MreC
MAFPKAMGVISGNGVVGVVRVVSKHLSIVQSVLHKDTHLSAMLVDNKAIGSLQWGDDLDPHNAQLIDINNNIKGRVGEPVVTSGYSLFPAGIAIGKVTSLHTKTGGFFLNMEVALSVDYGKLQYVNVVNNKYALEQANLEAQRKKDE